MKTADLFGERTVLSYEVFPPKPTTPVRTIYDTLEELVGLSPDFISVTYGAGGKGSGETLRIAEAILKSGTTCVAHLPCIGRTKGEVSSLLDDLAAAGVENVLALRGDIPPEGAPRGDFAHASDLVSFIRERGDFNIVAACYPEGHSESASLVEDIRHLKIKVDAGVNHLITQLFFDNSHFYAFKERCALAGIDVPIEAGIMPVTNKKQIERMVSLCGVELPRKFTAVMERYEDNPEALRDAGIAYAVDQIVDLIAQGADGIHLYTMNNPYVAKKIYSAIHALV